MRARPDGHARYRELLAAHLDRPLTRAEQRVVVGHLKTCVACQQAERDYRDQGAMLRALPTSQPPRDMWARTSTSLDREVSRSRYRYPRRRGVLGPRPAPAGALITVVAALGVVTALVATQLAPLIRTSPSEAGRPTPFAVEPQPLAFVAADNAASSGFSIYQTEVTQVCPTTFDDCYREEHFVRSQVALQNNFKPRNVELSPNGENLLVVGDDLEEDVIAVVMLTEHQGGGVRPDNAPSGSSGSGSSNESIPPGAERTPDRQPSSNDPGTGSPDPNGASGDPVVPGTSTPANSSTDGPPVSPPSSVVPGLTVLSIIEDVQSAGASPAWSVDGDTLAFSAMPVDGSHGPDVYVWRQGDDQARAITDDHSSFFASWSGRRVVVSRIAEVREDGQIEASTLVIDPTTLEERAVEGPQMWLPAVDPQRSHAIALYGSLESDGRLPRVREGTLYMLDWAAIDPFRAGSPADSEQPAPADTPATGGEEKPDPTPDNPSSADPDHGADVEGAAGGAGGSGDPGTPRPRDREGVPDGFQAVDPDGDPFRSPVIDWQVRWSSDGQVVGIWIADVAGSSWGRLVLFPIDGSGAVSNEDPLIGPTLAKRGFSLGLSKVAWVTRDENGGEGDVHIRTWGNDGVGGLLLDPTDLQGVVPAF